MLLSQQDDNVRTVFDKMKRIAVFGALPALAAVSMSTGWEAHAQEGKVGGLICDRIPGTGVNLIVHSSADVRCTFADGDGAEQWYMGETGIAVGIDLRVAEDETLYLGVLSSTQEFTPEGNFLTGNYAGARADVAVGASAGVALLIGGSDDTIALEPSVQTGEGVGAGAGIGYLNLEPDPLSLARVAVPSGDVFPQALYSLYFARGHAHRARPDYDGSDFYANKAIQSSSGVGPLVSEAIADQPETGEARERLMTALERRFLAPVAAAQAQVGYDCWIYALNNEASEDIQECNNSMLAGLRTLEAAITEDAEIRAEEAKIRERAEFNLSQLIWASVYFPTDSSTLNRDASLAISKVVERLGDLSEAEIVLLGSTDKIGTKTYNLELSEKRVASVRAALIAAGVSESMFTGETGFGEENPIFVYQRSAVDALSRRVDISILPKRFTNDALLKEMERIRSGG